MYPYTYMYTHTYTYAFIFGSSGGRSFYSIRYTQLVRHSVLQTNITSSVS